MANQLPPVALGLAPEVHDLDTDGVERIRALLTSLKGAPNTALECGGVLGTQLSGSRTPELNISSPSAGSDIPAAAPAATRVSSDGHTTSTSSMGRRPPLLRTAGVAALLDDGRMEVDAENDANSDIPEQTAALPAGLIPTPVSSAMPTGGRTSARGGPSHYRGVVWHKSNSKWEARIYEGGKQKFLGYFTNEDAAAMSYDDYAVRIHGSAAKLNFPDRYAGVELPPPTHPPPAARQHAAGSRTAAARARAVAAATNVCGPRVTPAGTARRVSGGGMRVQPVKGSSRFRGVSWNSNCSKWRAQVWKGSEVHHLGYFEREEDAARAYDEAVLRIRGPDAPTNYPRTHYGCSEDEDGTAGVDRPNATAVQRYQAAEEKEGGDSRMLGVSWSEGRQAWLSEIWDGKKYKFLGAFTEEADAAKAYDVACLAQHGDDALINFSLSTYETEMAAVALTNLAVDPDGYQELWAAHDGPAGSRASTPPAYHHTASDEMDVDEDKQDATNAVVIDQAVQVGNTEAVAVHRGTSRFLGVSWDRRKGRWFSQIQIRGNRKFLGYYEDELAAARAYDAAAVKLHGATAALNFPGTAVSTPTAAPTTTTAPALTSDSVSEEAASLKPWLAEGTSSDVATVSIPVAAAAPKPVVTESCAVAPAAAPMKGDDGLRQMAGHLYEFLNNQRQPKPQASVQAAARSNDLSPQAHNVLANMLRAVAVRQQEAAAAAWEEQMAAQHRLAVASAIEHWARTQQAPPAAPALAPAVGPAPAPGSKRAFSEFVSPAAAYQAALASWSAKKPRVF